VAEQLVASPARFARETDGRLFEELRRRLWDYEPLRSTRPPLELHVEHGTVRLGGRVRTLAMKEIAGYICQREPGVAVVRNELISDTEVVRSVADALWTDDELAPLCVRVDVRDGVATLSGDLPRTELEDRILDVARRAPGVAGVVSELTIRPARRPPTAPTPKPSETKPSEPRDGEDSAADRQEA
jgi:osmotically-inducible protein OsmY